MLIAEPLALPCGAVLPNRLAKAAMTEGLASPQGLPTPELARLYGLWSDGGAGLLITGNVQIDRHHLERPGNVIIDRPPSPEMKALLADWAAAGTQKDNHFWMQVSHAGRQTQINVNPSPKAPSAVKVNLPGGRFGEPVALTNAEIEDLIGRFANAASAAKEAGFTGVQIHSAHGYLISEFLSPLANRREDKWGGSLENRARFLLEVVFSVRSAVGPTFPVAVKLNSADFQRGGFAFDESLTVARWLEDAGVDLLEVFGGSYEQPAMMDLQDPGPVEKPDVASSTAKREAYFADFAKAMKTGLKTMPLMVTGGFRTAAAMEYALANGAAEIIGIGRPLCGAPNACADLLAGAAQIPRYEDKLALLPGWLRGLGKNKFVRTVSSFVVQNWYYAQIYNLGHDGQSHLSQSVFSATAHLLRREKRWLASASCDD